MKTKTTSFRYLAVVVGLGALSGQAERALAAAHKQSPAGSNTQHTAPVLPALPPGVSELKFSDFFVSPVGERGLVLTDKLRVMDGQRVRILGYMVRQEAATPGKLLLAPLPVQVCEHDSEFADDLPASTVHVFVPEWRGQPLPYTPQLLLLTGRLSVGNREEADGRISVVRLALDPSLRTATRKFSFAEKGAERLVRKP